MVFCLFVPSHVASNTDITLPPLPISEKQQHGKVLTESLAETAAHNWADLKNALEMGEEIHATYRREMEATWGPDHITTVLED